MSSFSRKRIPKFEDYFNGVKAWVYGSGALGKFVTHEDIKNMCVHCHMLDMSINEARDFCLMRIMEGKSKNKIWLD